MGNIIAYLKEDELEYMENNIVKRCEVCGHLEIFHNSYFEDMCVLPNCECRYRMIGEKEE